MTYLCAINDVDFALHGVGYIARSQPAVLVDSRCGSSGVIQVAGHHAGTLDVHFPMHAIFLDKIAVDVFQSMICQYRG